MILFGLCNIITTWCAAYTVYLAVPHDVVMEWGAKKGFCTQLKEPTNEAEEDILYDRARNQMFKTQRNLLNLVKDSGHFPEAEFDIPTYDGYSDVITFYSNYTRLKKRPSEEEQRAAVELLRKQLELTADQARPRWYFVFGPPDLENY